MAEATQMDVQPGGTPVPVPSNSWCGSLSVLYTGTEPVRPGTVTVGQGTVQRLCKDGRTHNPAAINAYLLSCTQALSPLGQAQSQLARVQWQKPRVQWATCARS